MSFYGQIESKGVRRFQAGRRRAMRRALFAAGVVIAIVSAASAIGYAITRPQAVHVVVPLDGFQAIVAGLVAVWARGPLRRHPGPTAFILLLGALAVPLATLATDPGSLILITSSIALFPISLALFFPWANRTQVAWTLCYLAGIAAFDVWWNATDLLTGAMPGSLMVAAAIGALVGLVGQHLRNREDERVHAREQASRGLRQKLRDQQDRLETLNERLGEVAMTDDLTGLGNRRRLREALEEDRDRLIRYGTGLGLIMLDLDHFKAFNDRYGHVLGDEALRMAATLIRSSIRPSDAAFRYGGEEFLVLLPNQDIEGTRVSAERIRGRIEEQALPHEANMPWKVMTISAGVSVARVGEDIDRWVDGADDALYRAKESGRNQTSE